MDIFGEEIRTRIIKEYFKKTDKQFDDEENRIRELESKLITDEKEKQKLNEDKKKLESDKKLMNEIVDNVIKSLDPKHKHLLTLCRPVNGKAEIDVAILNALLKAESKKGETAENKNNIITNNKSDQKTLAQLKLALKWNRIDIAKNYITDDLKDKINLLGDLMYIALEQNRVEFVDLFLDNGFSLKNFVTNRLLLKLFNEVKLFF